MSFEGNSNASRMSRGGIPFGYRMLPGSGVAGGQPAAADLAGLYHQSGASAGVNGALRDKAFIERWAGSTERWSTRIALGRGLDWAWDRSGIAQRGEAAIVDNAKPLQPAVQSISSNALSYRRLLNLGRSDASLRVNPGAFEYHTVAWKDLFKSGKYTDAVRQNFARAFQASEATGGLTPGQYLSNNPGGFFKNTVVNGNLKRIADTLKDGKNPGSGVMSALGLGLLGFDVLATTQDAYDIAKAKEDGTFRSQLNTWGSTAKTFVTKSAKNLVCWEVGTIGFSLGAGLFCVGTAGAGILTGAWLPIVAGVVTGALASTLTNRVLSYFMPDPEKPKPTRA